MVFFVSSSSSSSSSSSLFSFIYFLFFGRWCWAGKGYCIYRGRYGTSFDVVIMFVCTRINRSRCYLQTCSYVIITSLFKIRTQKCVWLHIRIRSARKVYLEYSIRVHIGLEGRSTWLSEEAERRNASPVRNTSIHGTSSGITRIKRRIREQCEQYCLLASLLTLVPTLLRWIWIHTYVGTMYLKKCKIKRNER